MANKNFRVKHGLEVAGSATIDNDLTVTGNLTVNGDTTTLNTATLSVEDNVVILNSNVTGTPSTNAGIEVERGDSTNTLLRWNESTDKWQFTNDGSTYYDMVTANTTYTQNASSTTGGANLNLVGSDSTTDSIKLASGTGVTVAQTDADTINIGIGQAVGTTSDVTFNSVDANITDGNYALGQLIVTRNSAYTPPTSALTTVTGSNGIVISSSTGGANGYSAAMGIRYHSGDTTAGGLNAPSIQFSTATGTSSAPTQAVTNLVSGTINFDGYTGGTSPNYASQIATANQGAGTSSLTPLQVQGYVRQNFTNSTTVTTAVTGASGTGSVATLTFATQNTAPYVVGQTVTIAGMTPSGYNGTYVLTAAGTGSISYANATTGFTTGGTIGTANTVTAAGMGFRIRGFANSTNLSAANRFNFMDLTASALTFKTAAYTFADEVITGSTLTSKNYMTLAATVGSINQDTFTLKNSAATTTYATVNSNSVTLNGDTVTLRNTAGTSTYANFISTGATITTGGATEIIRTATTSGANPALLLKRTSSATTDPVNNDGTGLRISTAGSNGTNYGIGFFNYLYQTAASGSDHEFSLNLAAGDQTGSVVNSVQTISSKPTNTRIFAGTAGASASVSVKLTVDANKITAAVPVAFPVYTITQAQALTGAVGWQICISDSSSSPSQTDDGMMVYWATNGTPQWRYIHNNGAL
jgi:hypothetical protein